MDREKIVQAVRMFLEGIGEDPDREGLRDTPERVIRMCGEIFEGYESSPEHHLGTVFTSDYDEMVLVRDIPLYSVCEHHLLPFIGKAHVAYIPRDGRITGLSKIGRVVRGYSSRLQVQERLTMQIARTIDKALNPLGVAVVIEAEHLCMTMRGTRLPGALTATSAVLGVFRKSRATRAEVLALLGRK